jgi:peptidoglycan-N-acetylglucosamine deacetylase
MSLTKRVALGAALAMSAALPAVAETKCANPNALGVARVVEIDTTGGPGFGFQHYKAYDFLEAKEVVLTFDDGPQKFHTEAVLAALAEQCTKAIFFSIGKMALGYPEILRKVAAEGHTIGSHTWSHQNLRKKKTEAEAVDEIERGMSAVKRAVGGPVAPFFRFPELADSPETLSYLAKRNVAMFSTDIDSFDFKFRNADHTVKAVIDRLEKLGKGIVLMHDIQPSTAKAVPTLLAELKKHGFKIVQMKAKAPLATLPEFDTAIESSVKGLSAAGTERPMNSVVRTVTDSGAPAPVQSKLGGDPQVTQGAAPPMAPSAVTSAAAPTPVPTPAPSATDAPSDSKQKTWFWQK